MQTKIVLAILLASTSSQAKFDTSTLKAVKSPTPQVSESTAVKRQKIQKYKEVEVDESDLKKIQSQLVAVDLILKNEKNKEKKIELYLRKANLQFMAAHIMGLKRAKAKAISIEEKTYLESALHILDTLVPHVKSQNERMSVILYLRGSILYELDKSKEGRAAYIASLRLSKNGVHVPGTALIIAEQYFDDEDFKNAIQYYSWIYPKLNPYQKALASYKLAWSYLSLREYPKAEAYFLSIINVSGKNFSDDSLRDLSFSVTQYKNEEQIVTFGRDSFKDESLRARFFTNVLKFYYQQDKKVPREQLFTEALQSQKEPQERLTLLFLRAQFDRREYPTQKWVDELQLFAKEYSSAPPKVQEKFLFADGSDLEENLDQGVKVFTDAYTGKLASKEKQSKPQLGKALNALIDVHLLIFPKSPKVAMLYDLWVDLCSDLSDKSCLAHIQAQLEKKEPPFDKDSKSLERVWIEQINILDKQITDSNASPSETTKSATEAFISKADQFIKVFPKNAERLNVCKKIAFYELKKKDYEAALPYLKDIYTLEPKTENLISLYQSLFQLKKFQEIVDDSEFSKHKQNENLAELKRESHLQLAITATAASDFGIYESHLKQFLASGPPKDKAVIAYLDYFNRLLDGAQGAKFQEEWRALSVELKKDARFAKIKMRAIDTMKDSGLYVDDESLYSNADSQNNLDALLVRAVLNKLGDASDHSRWAKLNRQHQHYFIGLLSVYDSAKLISFLKKEKNLDKEARQALYFAAMLQKGSRQAHFQPEEITLFKELVPASALDGKPSKLELKLDNLKPPGPNLAAAAYNKKVEIFVTEVRRLRSKVPKEIKGLQYSYQVSLLKVSKKKEEEGAQAILSSPLPEGLSTEQVTEYRKGLTELAQEFEGQAGEYAKLQDGLDKAYQQSRAKELENELPPIAADKWNFPKSENVTKVIEISKKTSVLAALIYLDEKLSKKQISTADYYWARSGLLLRVNGNEVMRDFLKSELTESGQDEIIQYWKGQKS